MLLAGGTFERLAYTNVELYSLMPEEHPIPKCLRRLRPFPGQMTGFAGGSLTEREQWNQRFMQ